MSNLSKYKGQYQTIVEEYSPKNKVVMNSLRAFWVGGSICILGQIITDVAMNYGMAKDDAATLSSVLLILLSTVLTGLNIYDNIGKYGGAGALVPITGFANSMVSSAMEFKTEGYVYGLGSKLFTIAGPVVVFGTIASVVVGIIYYFV
jgi:stage V sporulation protein AC